MTTPTPNPNDPFGSQAAGGLGGTTNPLGNTAATGQANPNSTAVTPSGILQWVLGKAGINWGTFDIIANTMLYSLCALGGVGMMLIGLNMLVKEVPGAAGVGPAVTGAVGGGARKIGSFAATAAAPEAAIPAKITRKVVGNLAVGGKHSK